MTASGSVPPLARLRGIDLLAIGASAGGIDALFTLLEGVRAGSRVAMVAVLHMAPSHDSQLAQILDRRLQFPVREAQHGAPLEGGTLAIAPPGYHLLVEPDHTLALSCDPPVRWSRPSIDVLLQSCAASYGDRVAALVMTGANDDGAAGAREVAQAGGLVAVQDPTDAFCATMPQAVIDATTPTLVRDLAGLRDFVQELLLA